MATAYLVRVTELAEANQLTTQLQGALDTRVVIEQAKRILANEHQIAVDDAFKLLRHHSRDHNIRLSDVANAVVKVGLRIPNH
ncbi:MAG TPA: ANTAR domain-containing protein [Acidimicrobiia bacterium]|nr:ANTAR domain-containing protein [Acidimicrobiia bacterium]